MNRYQRTLLNKMDDLTGRLQDDWANRHMTRSERRQAEQELRNLQSKFRKSYQR